MLRFHKFTAGKFWVDDYGSADNKDGFDVCSRRERGREGEKGSGRKGVGEREGEKGEEDIGEISGGERILVSHCFIQILYKYSPYHNIKDGTFPASLIFTADTDDRVVPGHSFKFAAALQKAQVPSPLSPPLFHLLSSPLFSSLLSPFSKYIPNGHLPERESPCSTAHRKEIRPRRGNPNYKSDRGSNGQIFVFD